MKLFNLILSITLLFFLQIKSAQETIKTLDPNEIDNTLKNKFKKNIVVGKKSINIFDYTLEFIDLTSNSLICRYNFNHYIDDFLISLNEKYMIVHDNYRFHVINLDNVGIWERTPIREVIPKYCGLIVKCLFSNDNKFIITYSLHEYSEKLNKYCNGFICFISTKSARTTVFRCSEPIDKLIVNKDNELILDCKSRIQAIDINTV